VKVLVTIVNYRTARLVQDLLASLASDVSSIPGAFVVVADNDSRDGSAEAIASFIEREGYGGWAEVLPLPQNGGFSYGNNEVIRRSFSRSEPPRYVWLLNPDTSARPGALRELVGFMDRHPEVGIAGSRIEDADGSPSSTAGRFLRPASEFEDSACFGPISKILSHRRVALEPSDQPFAADWLSGASLMVRREVFERIGLFDEGYFLYFEEVDFCLRAARAGFRCWYAPASRVVHYAGQSTGVTGKNAHRSRRPGYWFDSRRRYFVKNFGRRTALLADIGRLSGSLVKRVVDLVRETPRPESPLLLRDFVRHTVRAWSALS